MYYLRQLYKTILLLINLSTDEAEEINLKIFCAQLGKQKLVVNCLNYWL